jgi:hypothetical protein
MKTLPTLFATAVVVALFLAPLTATAAGTISITSPTSGSAVHDGSYTIAGTVTPAPGQVDTVGISVKNPSGTVVDTEQTSASPTTGAWSLSAVAGGPLWTASGTYTITATDSLSATGSTTFTYTAPTTATAGYVTVLGPSLLLPGQTGNVFIWASSTGSVTAWYLAPGSSSTTALAPNRVSPSPGGLVVYSATFTLPAGAPDGVYLVGASVSNVTSGFSASNIGSFTVNGQLATKASSSTGPLQKDLAGNFTALNSAISALSTAVGTVGSAVGTANTGITNIQTTLGNVNTAVQSLSGLSDQLKTATSGISSTQTYVLVVAVLAAITLVLELAILVRKLS